MTRLKTEKKLNTNPPKISVIIPVYNAEEYLRTCLDSVIHQTLKDIEKICVNDGSTDRSLDILREYEKKDKRVLVIDQENKGAGAARNNGMQYANGDYLSFLDADDFFEIDMFQKAYRQAQLDNDEIIVWRSDLYIQKQNKYRDATHTINKNLLPNHSPFSGTDVTNVFNLFIGWPWDKLFRRDFIQKNGLLFQEQRTTNDLLFVYSAVVKANRISVINDVFAHHRIFESGKSLSVSRELSWGCFYNALIELRNQLKKWGLYEQFEQDFINYGLNFSLWNLNTIRGKSFIDLYNKLRSEWFNQLEILNKPSSFYNEKDYELLDFILKHDADEYLLYRLDQLIEEKTTMEDSLISVQNSLLNSNSYKIGSIITYIPGRIKRKILKILE